MQLECVLSKLEAKLVPAGLDIIQPLALNWYNAALPDDISASRIPHQGTAGSHATVILIGNSRALWRPFISACHQDPSLLLECLHPLETYIEKIVREILSTELDGCHFRVFWSHSTAELEGGLGHFIAAQRMAASAGLAYLDPLSHLSFHPTFGPWFSLRCAIVLDDELYNHPQPDPVPRLLDAIAEDRVKAAMHAATSGKREGSYVPEMCDVRSSWKLWLAVRDAAAPDHPKRYSEEQVLYHYTGDRALLKALSAKIGDEQLV